MNKGNDFLNSGRRDNVEIMAAIVVLTQEASTITNMMSRVNLGYEQTRKYNEFMLKKGLIKRTVNGKRTLFKQTGKGCKFFRLYCEMLRIVYGEDFLKNKNNLAVACLSQCQEHTL